MNDGLPCPIFPGRSKVLTPGVNVGILLDGPLFIGGACGGLAGRIGMPIEPGPLPITGGGVGVYKGPLYKGPLKNGLS